MLKQEYIMWSYESLIYTGFSESSLGTLSYNPINVITDKFCVLKQGEYIPFCYMSRSLVDKLLNYSPLLDIMRCNVSTASLTIINKKFWAIFRNYSILTKYHSLGKEYWIAKGLIADENQNPYFILMKKATNAGFTAGMYNLERSGCKVVIKKEVFSTEFKKENKSIHRILFDKIIPDVMTYGIAIEIVDSIDIWKQNSVNPSINFESIQDIVKPTLVNLIKDYYSELE